MLGRDVSAKEPQDEKRAMRVERFRGDRLKAIAERHDTYISDVMRHSLGRREVEDLLSGLTDAEWQELKEGEDSRRVESSTSEAGEA